MSTDSTTPEVVTLDPSNEGDMARLVEAFYNTDEMHAPTAMAKAVRALSAPPLPEEPPAFTVVIVPHGGSSLVDQPYTPYSKWVRADGDPEDASWFRLAGSAKYAESRTWPEVCALGTPEVLEPETVKALREQVAGLRRTITTIERAQAKSEDRAKDFEERYEIAHQSFMASQGEVDTRNLQIKDLIETLESVRKQAKEWAAADYEPANDASAATLNTTNRHGRELLHLLDATEDEPAEPSATPLLDAVAKAGIRMARAKLGLPEDEPAEPAPVEVTEPDGVRIKRSVKRVRSGKFGTIWARRGKLWLREDEPTVAENYRTDAELIRDHGPLTLVEPSAGESA